MAIGSAIKKGTLVYVYDEKGRHISTISTGNGDLLDYTSSTVTVKKGSIAYTYDEKGRHISTHSA